MLSLKSLGDTTESTMDNSTLAWNGITRVAVSWHLSNGKEDIYDIITLLLHTAFNRESCSCSQIFAHKSLEKMNIIFFFFFLVGRPLLTKIVICCII